MARAIYHSNIPIISAVGHETDFTISDFVADLRAPTPSAAAELAVSDVKELKIKINNYINRYKISLRRKIDFMKLRYDKVMKSRAFSDPLQSINEKLIRIDQNMRNLEESIKDKIKTSRNLAVNIISKIDAMSPLKTLTRGYCISEKNGIIIKSIKDVKKDDEVTLIYEDGKQKAKIL